MRMAVDKKGGCRVHAILRVLFTTQNMFFSSLALFVEQKVYRHPLAAIVIWKRVIKSKISWFLEMWVLSIPRGVSDLDF